MRIRPMMLAPPLIFAAIAAIFWVGMARENPDELPSALTGQPAPAVEVIPLGQAPVFGDDDLRSGEARLVNFWASWCVPCRAEHPNLEKLAADGVTIYGVNYKDKPGDALGFLEELGNPFAAMGADANGKMGINWGVYGVPETYLIDGEGRIVLRHAGPITQRVIDNKLRPAMETLE
ncbi:MAG: DsbE family thiol:disulfide interchange protein [Sediminimonas sp.]|nr:MULTISPECIES: DsbE family thiol:disulfide interchange protein [Sediminimonas]MDR9484038.1 DsbE family thiol:disulfide interchange protein [Sediminimonas sp.]